MKNTLLILSFLLFLASGVFAQNTQGLNCPTVDVAGGGVVELGEPMTFTVTVENYDLSKLTLNWTVSGGEFIEGQGTPTIKVLRKNYDESITAAVEVKGLPEGCTSTVSETGSPICRPPARLFDEYGPLPNDDIEARTYSLFLEIGNNPGARSYIISYGTNGEIARREKQIRSALSSMKADKTIITLVNGGANPRGNGIWTRVWIVPPGADNPTPDM